MVRRTESIIPLTFNGLSRGSASGDWPFLAEIGRNLTIFGNLGEKIGHFRAESSERQYIIFHTTN